MRVCVVRARLVALFAYLQAVQRPREFRSVVLQLKEAKQIPIDEGQQISGIEIRRRARCAPVTGLPIYGAVVCEFGSNR